MGFGAKIDQEPKPTKNKQKQRKSHRVIEFDEPVFLAAQELVNRLQSSDPAWDLNTLVQVALQRELHRREVTWWESRVSKAMRVMSGLQP